MGTNALYFLDTLSYIQIPMNTCSIYSNDGVTLMHDNATKDWFNVNWSLNYDYAVLNCDLLFLFYGDLSFSVVSLYLARESLEFTL